MNLPSPSPASSPRSRRLRRAAAAGAALILAAVSFAVLGPPWATGDRRSREASANSPYLNTRPGVAYVGDEVCARCHGEIAAAYRGHPMGRSMAPVDAGDGPPIGPDAGLPFEFKGVRYAIDRRDGRTIHRASRQSPDGATFAEVAAEVRYALGSGTRGITYLFERDGFLFQSPIAWFAQKRRWDISPGYGGPEPRPHFERAIQPMCLFCHADQVHHVAGTLNRYEAPIFRGHAIGCERCHGPGALHVDAPGSGPTIVNPGDLAPALRESVCQQCHLQGWFRFERAGRDVFDFRPGLPLHRFLAVFVREESDPDRMELIGQVEQMESSRCYRGSGGELGCISCHDPHRLPPPEAKAAYYRGRCMECHETRGCALPTVERRSRGPGEDCVACHMPRPAVADVPHTVTTDHRIPRVAGAPAPGPARPRTVAGLPAAFVPRDYHWDLMTREERRASARDRGMALELAAQALRASPRMARLAASQSIPLLEAAVRDRPDDLPAAESLGYALGMLDRLPDALRAYEGVLRIEPRREQALPYLARTLAALGQPDRAIEAMRQAIAVDPWRSEYHLAMAQECARTGDWSGAVSACRESLRLNPERIEARSLLVGACLRSGNPAEADAEFRTLLRFDPDGRPRWERWYQQQKRAGPVGAGAPSQGRHPRGDSRLGVG